MPVTKAMRQRVFDRDGWRCRYCRKVVKTFAEVGNAHPDLAVADHQVARGRAGRDEEDNLVTACWTCNSRKGKRTPSEYQAWLLDRFDWEETRL